MESLAETATADRAVGAGQGPGALPARRHHAQVRSSSAARARARPPSSRPPSANSGPHSHLIRLTATPALAAVPFGALAPLPVRLPDRELDSYAAVVEAMAGSLKSEADRPLFVVDDAHCLDHGTVRQLARRRRPPALPGSWRPAGPGR